LMCRVLSHVLTMHTMGIASLGRHASLITRWVLQTIVFQHLHLLMCQSLHILRVSLLLLCLHICHLLICVHNTLKSRIPLLIHHHRLELLMVLLGLYQRFMLPTRLSDPRLLQLLACKRPNETRLRALVLSVMKIVLGQSSQVFLPLAEWGLDSFLLQFDFPAIVNKGCSWHRKVSINAKIGIGKLIHLPFFCPSRKWEEKILIVVGSRATLLSCIRCTDARDSYLKADGFCSSKPFVYLTIIYIERADHPRWWLSTLEWFNKSSIIVKPFVLFVKPSQDGWSSPRWRIAIYMNMSSSYDFTTCISTYIYELGTRHVVARRFGTLDWIIWNHSLVIPWFSGVLVLLTFRFLVYMNRLGLTSCL
jgi:hypothetical protein